MGSNACTGLGGEAYHGIRNMRSVETEERPTEAPENTNRKLLFPVSKTPHNISQNNTPYQMIILIQDHKLYISTTGLGDGNCHCQ